MAEIVKASKQEANALLDQTKAYCEDVKSRKLNLEKRKEKLFDDSDSYSDENVGKGSSESGMYPWNHVTIGQYTHAHNNNNNNNRMPSVISQVGSGRVECTHP